MAQDIEALLKMLKAHHPEMDTEDPAINHLRLAQGALARRGIQSATDRGTGWEYLPQIERDEFLEGLQKDIIAFFARVAPKDRVDIQPGNGLPMDIAQQFHEEFSESLNSSLPLKCLLIPRIRDVSMPQRDNDSIIHDTVRAGWNRMINAICHPEVLGEKASIVSVREIDNAQLAEKRRIGQYTVSFLKTALAAPSFPVTPAQ